MNDRFIYTGFKIEEDLRTVRFLFTIKHHAEAYDLTETLRFPVDLSDTPAIHASLRALHLALGISYYKIFADPTIEHPYTMDSDEAGFWNEVFVNGLGEYLYVNKLPRDRLANFSAQEGRAYEPDKTWRPDGSALLGIGGGKDSIVGGELLKKLNVPLSGFVMATGEQLGQSKAVADTMQVGLYAVERMLDKQLLVLQERDDAFKGHVPISLIFALVGATLAIATGTSYVVVANENSASIPRAEWEGKDVNHQWSKSFAFEKRLQRYLHVYISEHLTYFSVIRPLSSVAVARIFANLSQYFEIFTSDNHVFRIDPAKRPHGRWSLESPKSLSSFILLAPWLSEADLLRTFGRDFLDEHTLEPLFYELMGLRGHQPLDCVGTVDELVLSLNLTAEQNKFARSFLMQKAVEHQIIRPAEWQELLTDSLRPAPENAFPAELSESLLHLLAPALVPLEKFRDKDVVFVGAGQGRAMAGIQEYLEKHASIRSFIGVDKKPGSNPLGFLMDFPLGQTVFVKNEGIPGHEMPVPYITAMQLFFELVPLLGAKTIGITGTKGKSTTAALTAHILKTAGKDVILAGNIGTSPLPALDKATPECLFVLELSSYQLSDLQASPDIGAVINLYNDHTDWHGSLDAYWEAKRNIMRFIKPNGLFVYNPDFETLRTWAEQAQCRVQAIDPTEPYDLGSSQLYGAHNVLNIQIARAIAREVGISDDVTHQAVLSFRPLEHRMEFVAEKNGLLYINDAIGMTPESTLASLQAISEKYGKIGCILLGGQDRDYDFATLMQKIAEYSVPSLVFFPETIDKMRRLLPDGYAPEILETENMREAVAFASQHAPEGSVILLSTAAPSYVLWKDFEEKGTQFKEAVNTL